MRVSLGITCFNDALFPETGKATVAVLERLGHLVDFPEAQTCCGQMHNNSGGCVAKFATSRGWSWMAATEPDQAATWNSSAMRMACARMSRPPTLRTCPFLIIAITS
jgi:Cysteine-rich domain